MNRESAEAVADLLHSARENAVLSLSIVATLRDAGSPTMIDRLVDLCDRQSQHLQALSHTASALMLEGGKDVARSDSTDD